MQTLANRRGLSTHHIAPEINQLIVARKAHQLLILPRNFALRLRNPFVGVVDSARKARPPRITRRLVDYSSPIVRRHDHFRVMSRATRP